MLIKVLCLGRAANPPAGGCHFVKRYVNNEPMPGRIVLDRSDVQFDKTTLKCSSGSFNGQNDLLKCRGSSIFQILSTR